MRRRPIDPGVVLYESFGGSGMLDNPEAIFDRLRRDPAFAHLTHVWVIADPAERRRLRAQWRGEASVRFVPHGGMRYWRVLSTAGLVINNATFPPEFAKRPGQRYLNTWHGTPLKSMGYDMPDGPREAANTMRNFLQADWLLSQNRFMTETMYRSAYRLDGVFAGEIVEEGYPRTDRQRLDAAGRAAVRVQLAARGLEFGDRPIVLYAPTWKGTRFSQVLDDVADLVGTVRRLQDRLGDRYAVLLKTHQSVFAFAQRDPELKRMLVPNDIPTNTVLGVTDLLVTDYSSIQFDFLATGRPIAYFVPDLAGYAGTRGYYLPIETWLGPLSHTVDELAEHLGALSSPESDSWAASRSEWTRRFASKDDGGATDRVIDIVLRGRGTARRTRDLSTRKPRVLFYVGGLRSNGITSAAIGLVNALAASGELDVSVVYGRPQAAERRANAERISPAVRQFLRQGGMNATRFEHHRRRDGTLAGDRVWRDEWLRVFGSAHFDTVVDFSGYSAFWAQLLLVAPARRHLIWLHNDLVRDAERTVGGRRHLRRALHDTFALYSRFDGLVSVSGELARINRVALARFAPPEKFTWVPNLVDADRVRADAALAHTAGEPGRHGASDLRWFATVGRLSPEKNHARLIRAFARVRAHDPRARLLIIGGGPLRAELEALARSLGVADDVVFAGAVPNPATLLAGTDCFVLSSDYEGMPMVLLEAAVLGMPIISTRFGSVAGALPGVGLRITGQSEEELAAAMAEFLAGAVPPVVFDVEAHNEGALRQAQGALFPSLEPTSAASGEQVGGISDVASGAEHPVSQQPAETMGP